MHICVKLHLSSFSAVPFFIIFITGFLFTLSTLVKHSKCEQNVNDDDDDGRIMNGQIVPDGKYPFIASLQVSPEPCAGTSPGAHFCGAAVINDNTVLTAAHCLTAMNLTETSVLVGVYSMDASNLDDYHCYQADKLVVHPQYTAEHFSGTPDIGVVKLKRAIEFEKTNKQVKLLSSVLTGFTESFKFKTGEPNLSSTSE